MRLEQFGLSKLSVRDDGAGVARDQIINMVAPHTTSKLSNISDLDSLDTYGFRGEALSSLCQVSELSIVTRTQHDVVSSRSVFSGQCQLVTSGQCAGKVGTEITASNLFINLPVRRNYYKNTTRRKEEVEKVKKLIYSFAIVNPSVRLSLYHDKVNVWSSHGSGSMLDAVSLVIGRKESKHMEQFQYYLDADSGDIVDHQTYLRVSGLLPSLTSDLGRSSKDFTWIFVNKRPVEFKELEKMLKQMFSEACNLETAKYPVSVVSVEMMEDMKQKLDPNLEPNKQKVGLAC